MSESIQAIPPFVDAPAPSVRHQRQARPTAREWSKHIGLFLLTAITTTIAGIVILSPELAVEIAPPATLLDYVAYVPEYYVALTGAFIHQALIQPSLLAQGATFAASLLAMLLAHESGHYIACRHYGVDATLPFFIPAPPLFLAGTFGALIKIKSPIPSRRALFDIGVAGPLAGFVVAVPIAIIGLLTSHPAIPYAGTSGVIFHDPLLVRFIARALGIGLDIAVNPFQFAAWIGLLVTSLNLMPVGQLDGGHATFAVFGARVHKWLGQVAFATMSVLAILGLLWHSSPSGFVYAVLLAIMLRVRHPQVQDEREALGRVRMIVALLTLAVFILSFMPFPITIF